MIDPQEKVVVGKVMKRILPFLFLLYIIAFLDRVNISFAALHMNAELGFSAAVYGMGAGLFFIGYFFMEIPGNLIMAKVGARIWLARILITWGLISGMMAFVSVPWQFYTVRFFLGVAEASFAPGVIYYLSNWFTKKDQAKAVAIFLMAMPACNVMGAPISSYLLGISWLDWAGWKWMFILEAIPAVIFGVVTFFYLDDRPSDAKWLNDEERNWLVKTMERETGERKESKHHNLKAVFSDKRVILLSLAYFAWITGLYGITMFLPTLIKGLSATMSDMNVGYLTMIPNSVALICMFFISRNSDRTGERRYHTALCMLVGAFGLTASVFLADISLVASMVFFSCAVAGVYSAFGPFWAIPSSFLAGVHAAGAIAMINSIGNLGGFVGPYAMGFIRDYTQSFNAGMIFLAISLTACAIIITFVKKDSGSTQE